MKPEVLYCDNHLLVLFKPAGIPSQADDSRDPDLLTIGKQYLKQRFNKPGNVFLGLVHRLDRPASGVVVLARTSKAAARLTAAFKSRHVHKRYLALVKGRLPDQGRWEDQLLKEDRVSRVVSPAHPKGKHAALTFQRLAFRDNWSLADITLETGRSHQIRLQFSSRGHVVLGDFRYGSDQPLDGKNLALHCYTMGLDHPTTKTPHTFQAPPPPSWRGWFDTEIDALFQ